MPRRRRPDQGPPVPRVRNACARCRLKRFKCSNEDERPCHHCVAAKEDCVAIRVTKRQKTSRGDSFTSVGSSVDTVSSDEHNPPSEGSIEDQDIMELDRGESQAFSDSLGDFVSGAAGSLSSIVILPSLISTEIAVTPPNAFDLSDPAILDSFLESPIFLSRPSTPTASSLLELNPFYKELWYHFTEVLSCLHTSHEKTSNPIVRILSPVAQSSEALLAVLLASSLENYRSLRGLEPDEELLTTLINTAVSGVQKELSRSENGQINDQTLAAVIALCDFEVVARKRATTSSWRLHLDGAKRIIALRGGPDQGASTSELYRFLLKWLAYFDVMSSMTSTTVNTQPSFQGTYWIQSAQGTAQTEEDFKLDPYMSFLQDVVPYFIEIGHLTRRTSCTHEQMNLRQAYQLHLRCRVIETHLQHLIGSVTGQSWMGAKKLAILTDCHDAFVYSTLIHLYRRVEGLPSRSQDVRVAMTKGLEHIANSCQHDDSEIDSSLLFPLFTFGCEAASDREKEYVLDRLTALGALGLGNVDRAIEVLLSVWTADGHQSSGHSLDWTEILRLFNWEVNLA